jgi:hypothetical protein
LEFSTRIQWSQLSINNHPSNILTFPRNNQSVKLRF